MLTKRVVSISTVVLALALTPGALAQTPLGSGWTYQGQLKLAGSPLNDTADFEFTLYDASAAGNMVGSVIAAGDVTVVDGLFTIELDFGVMAFNGNSRWLEIDVRSPAGSGSFTTLSPRQPLTANPYSLQTRGIFVDDLHNVGIGTTSPSSLLDVEGPTEVQSLHIDGYGEVIDSSGMWLGELAAAGSNRQFTYNDSGSAAGAEVYYDSGHVGIGVALPWQKLDVDGAARIGSLSSDDQGYFQATSSWAGVGYIETPWIYANAIEASNQRGAGSTAVTVGTSNFTGNNEIALITNGSERLFVDSTGNIGIGTTSPSSKLSVNGNVDITGTVGIGTTSPGGELDISASGSPSVYIQTTSGAFEQANLNFVGARTASNGDLAQLDFDNNESGDDEEANARILVEKGANLDSASIDFLTRYDTASSLTSAVFLEETGNVGIGTTTPDNKLTVAGDADFTGYVGIGTTTPTAPLQVTGMIISGEAGVTDGEILLEDSGSIGNNPGIRTNSDGDLMLRARSTSGDIEFETGNPESMIRMVILDDGNVGIGTTSPAAGLTVTGISGGSTNVFQVEEADGTMGFAVDDEGDVGVHAIYQGCTMSIKNKAGNNAVFYCAKSNGSVVFRIQADGDIYAESLSSTGVGTHDLVINNSGKIQQAASSRRYKENIEPFMDDFDLILQTKLKQWTGKGEDSGQFGFGFIAEEIKELGLESLMLYDKDGRVQSLKFRNIPFYTLQVVKRHEREVKALQAENSELRGENEEIRDRLAKLEELVGRLAAK